MVAYRNEDLQEQLWAISVRDVRDFLSPETRHRFCSGQSFRVAGSVVLPHTRRHSFRSTIRVKPEDRERLIDSTVDCGRGGVGGWEGDEGLMTGAEEEEGEGE